MGLFDALLQTTRDVVTAPLDVLEDVTDTVGITRGRPGSRTGEKIEDLVEDVGDIFDSLF